MTALELLPVFAFDEDAAPEGRRNIWGYQPLSFFAPNPGYSSRRDPLGVLDEFRDLVKAAHRAGMEIILDVVYNHTAEGGADGPTISLRGLANETYYILDETGAYADYSGALQAQPNELEILDRAFTSAVAAGKIDHGAADMPQHDAGTGADENGHGRDHGECREQAAFDSPSRP